MPSLENSAAHWGHLRTANAIESSFALVRHRSRQTKGCGSREGTLALDLQTRARL